MPKRFPEMELHQFTITFNILTISLPLVLFLLLCWASSTTTTPTLFPPPRSSSVFSAAQILRAHGYSLFANALVSASSTDANFSGTILAPPDFAFSLSAAKFSSKPFSHASLRPSAALLHYHTLQIPSLNWFNLNKRHDGDEFQTHFKNNYCLFLYKNANGNAALSSSKKPIHAVTIRHPDLYSDDTLTIHGVDGVLDPTVAKKCSLSNSKINPTAGIQSLVDRYFLDHAIRVLRTRGFLVVATAMALRRSHLLTVKAITIFAPSDTAFFAMPHGFRYDFHHHIVPKRLRSAEMGTFSNGMEFDTLAPNKKVLIRFGEEDIRINGVRVVGGELYHNKWIIVYPISMTLDDAVDGYRSGLPESHFPNAEENEDVIPSASPASKSELIGGPSPSREGYISGEKVLVPVVAPIMSEPVEPQLLSPETFIPANSGNEAPEITPTSDIKSIGPALLLPEVQITGKSIGSLSPAPTGVVPKIHCRTGGPNDVVPGLTSEIEGRNLFCPVNNELDLRLVKLEISAAVA